MECQSNLKHGFAAKHNFVSSPRFPRNAAGSANCRADHSTSGVRLPDPAPLAETVPTVPMLRLDTIFLGTPHKAVSSANRRADHPTSGICFPDPAALAETVSTVPMF